jgi:hypothetical protein
MAVTKALHGAVDGLDVKRAGRPNSDTAEVSTGLLAGWNVRRDDIAGAEAEVLLGW